MKRVSAVLTVLLSVGMMCGATAAKGVFSVSATKTVRFANAASQVGETALFQWTNLSAAIEDGWEVLTGDEWS